MCVNSIKRVGTENYKAHIRFSKYVHKMCSYTPVRTHLWAKKIQTTYIPTKYNSKNVLVQTKKSCLKIECDVF